MKYTKHKKWTAQDIKMIVKIWNDHDNTEDIAKKVGRTKQEVQTMASYIRKFGYNLPKKFRGAYLEKLIKETLGIK